MSAITECDAKAWSPNENPRSDAPWYCVLPAGHGGDHGDPECLLAWPQGSTVCEEGRAPNFGPLAPSPSSDFTSVPRLLMEELEVAVSGGGEDDAGSDADVREVAERLVEAWVSKQGEVDGSRL